jgi:hypothetical protein
MALGIGGAVDATATKLLFQRVNARQTDREVAMHPVIQGILRETQAYQDLTKGANATAIQYADIDLASATAAATAEGGLPAGTTYAPTTGTFAPARQAAYWLTSDEESANTPALDVLAQVAGLRYEGVSRLSPGNIAAIAQIVAMGNAVQNNWLMDQLKAILPSFGTSVGTPGSHITWAQYKSGIKARRDAGVRGGGLTLIHRNSWDAVETEIISAGGVGANSRVALGVVDRQREDTLYMDMYSATDVAVVTGLSTAGADTIGGTIYPGALHLDIHVKEPVGSRKVVIQTPFFAIYEIGYAGGSQAGFELVFHAATEIVRDACAFKITSKTAV